MSSKQDKNSFSLMIEKLAQSQQISHMDAIIEYCTKNELEIEVAASLVNNQLKQKIAEEARDLRFLPKTGKLPL